MTRRAHYGYVVVEINQASSGAERVIGDGLHVREWAELLAEAARREVATTGRREQYIVCEVLEAGS
jgi:hypothetical protein